MVVIVVRVRFVGDGVRARRGGSLNAVFGILDDDTLLGGNAEFNGRMLVDRGRGFAGAVEMGRADDPVENEVEPLGDGFDPVGRRRGDDRHPNVPGVELVEQLAELGHERGAVGVDLAGDPLEALDELLALDTGGVVVVEVVVDLAVVHAGDLGDGNLLFDDRREQFLAFAFDPVVLRIDNHAIHVEQYGVHTLPVRSREIILPTGG